MSTHQLHRERSGRPGVILVVVVACLALFLSVGIAFVFYANQQAVSMRYQREASGGGRSADVNQGSRGFTDEAPPSAVDLFNQALGQLIYGVPDDNESGYYTAMRGHELARGIYGKNVSNILSASQVTLTYKGNAAVYLQIKVSLSSGLNPGDGVMISGVSPATYNNGPSNPVFFVSPTDQNDPAPPPTPPTASPIGTMPVSTFYCRTQLPSQGSPATSFGFVQRIQNAPYDGFGRMHYTFTAADPAGLDPLARTDSYNLVNYARTPFNSGGYQAGVIRYPELEFGNLINGAYIYNYVSKNAPYTYPDENNMFLGAVRPSDGRVLIPSFHRPWLYNIAATTEIWTSSNTAPQLYTNPYKTLRAPLPFPPMINQWQSGAGLQADSSYGDVENLPGKTQPQYDSIWMDLDAPVHMWRGQYYKPLFAFLVVDLDGRINVNTAGNLRGPGQTHSSYQGIGPWEVDLTKVLGANAAQQVLAANHPLSRFGLSHAHPSALYCLDDTVATNTSPGFMVGNGVPAANGHAIPNIPYYSAFDLDGSPLTGALSPQTAGSSTLATLPMQPYHSTPMLVQGGQSFPYGGRFGSGNAAERLNHPMIYNPYFGVPNSTPLGHTRVTHVPNLTFSPWDMYYLNSTINKDAVNYPHSWLGSLGMSPQLGLPTNITGNRLWVTTISNDLQRPGIRPWLWQNQYGMAAGQQPSWITSPPNLSTRATANSMYAYPAPTQGAAPSSFPVGGPINSPTGVYLPNPNSPPAGNAQPNAPQSSPSAPGSDFDAAWRSDVATGLGAIDLNRKLSDYRLNPNLAYEHANNITAQTAARAISDRQQFAKDIFYRLLVSTGVNATFHPSLTLPPPLIADTSGNMVDNPEFLCRACSC